MEEGKVELLSAEEIEKRMYSTEKELGEIYEKMAYAGGAHSEDYKERAQELEKNLQAYETAIDYACL